MPNAALSAYLARNYLDGAKAEAMLARSGGGDGHGEERRKRKKKRVEGGSAVGGSSSTGLRMVDDSDEHWRAERNSDEEVAAVFVLDDDESRARRRKSNWSKLGEKAEEEEDIVSSEDRPQLADADGLGLDRSAQDAVEQQLVQQGQIQPPKKESKIRAGLKTREEMRAERLEREAKAAQEATISGSTQQKQEEEERQRREREREERRQDTVYRDATGRRIDIRKDDEERAKVKEERARREREKQDWNKGQVQLDKIRASRQREEEEKHTTFARYSNDERMNKEMREISRTADPALGFLTAKKDANKGPQKPLYKGSFPPNRFSIRPGHRWDGVERSNGFENRYFQKKHQRIQRREEADAWSREDM